jgi:hypothetical protein
MRTLLRVSVLSTCSVFGCNTSNSGTLFDVTTTLSSTTCGAAVEVEDSEEFQVRLTFSDDTLKWYEVDTGDSIEGSVSDDEFTLAEVQIIELTEPSGTDPGCSVRRHDSYTGTLTTSGDSITKAKGEVISSYTEASDYACDPLIGVSGGFSDLPCEINYTFVATPAK